MRQPKTGCIFCEVAIMFLVEATCSELRILETKMAAKDSAPKRHLSAEQSANMSVRLDIETKELLGLVAMAMKVSEKEIAIEAIQLFCNEKLDMVNARINELRNKYASRARKKS